MKLTLVTSTLVLTLIAAHSSVFAQSARRAPELFRDVERGMEQRLTALPAAIRQRSVELDVALLREGSVPQDVQDSRPRSRPRRLTFTLFPDAVLDGTLAVVQPAYGDGRVASFSLEGDPDGVACLSVVGEAVTGTFRTGGRLFQLHHVEGGVHTLSEVDELLLPSCGTPDGTEDEPVPGHARDNRPSPVTERATTGQILDMLVVYTDDARLEYGGVDGINSLINLAIFESNQGYAQSDVVMRLNLVHTHEVVFAELGLMHDWVVQMRNGGDGVLDEVHALRNAYGADAVSLITATGNHLGVAYNLWTSLAVNQALNAFSATRGDGATGSATFAHELGHNLGCQHDRANTSGPALFPYAYGYRTTSGAYRSIMAYAPGTRLNLWSNPAKRAPNGEAMGVANTTEDYRVLNNVVGIASGWRASRSTGHQVTTTFAGGNGYAGNMFDLQPKDDITLTGIDIHTSAPVGEIVRARVWFRNGSYVGFDRTSAGWQELALLTGTSAGLGRPTTMNVYSDRRFDSGNTYGIYVEFLDYAWSYTGSTYLAYTNGAPTRFENDHVALVSGVGKTVGGFAGETISNRIWNGNLRYRGGSGQYSLVTTFSGQGLSAGNVFTVTPINTVRLTSLDLYMVGSGPVTVDVWYKEGTYGGAENNPSAWTFAGTDFSAVVASPGEPTRITVSDVFLWQGRTYSIYVNLASYGLNGQALRNSFGTASYFNSDLTIRSGIGRGPGAFSGAALGSRIWNGWFNYVPYYTFP